MSGAESALLGSAITAGSSLMALIVSRVKCLYQRDEDGHCSPKCGCMSAPLEDHHEILVDKQEIQGAHVHFMWARPGNYSTLLNYRTYGKVSRLTSVMIFFFAFSHWLVIEGGSKEL